ncbi:MAG: hypothetical protein ACO1OO_08170 [Flavisolibacter sp.]
MHHENDKPPLFKAWTTWYVLLLAFLLVLILVFYYITKTFS